ncbi:MAG: aminopeptidase [Candidatus Thermoplasmatota archaeon]
MPGEDLYAAPDLKNDCMVDGAKAALANVLSLKAGERVLVVMDAGKREIGRAFAMGAMALGAKATEYMLLEEMRPYRSVPRDLAEMFRGYNVIINTFCTDAQETPFRVELLYKEITYDARVGHAPGITEEMMTRGPLGVDYAEVRRQAEYLMERFKDAVEVRVTTPNGTDITMDIRGRGFLTDVIIENGTFGNLPAGEIWCAPVENAASGTVICDGTIGDLGQVPAPLKIELRNGKVAALESEAHDLVEQVRALISLDSMSDVIGELGIGLNPGARLNGNMLEDEKAVGTAHIALGNNIDMINGQNNSKTHRDFLFYNPTFHVKYADGSSATLIKDGKVV